MFQSFKIAIVGSDPLFGEALCYYCINGLKCAICDVYPAVERTVQHLKDAPPDFVLLNIRSGADTAFTFIDDVRSKGLNPRFIGISADCTYYMAYTARRYGFSGWFDMNTETLAVLKTAIRHILSGGCYYAQTFRDALDRRATDACANIRNLTKWEQHILSLIGYALSDAEISLELDISSTTVKSHRSAIMRKLGISNTPKLVHFSIRHGFASVSVIV